ncbi:MAG: hypothetical protein JXB49_25990 [Bacteroidales bacterium]|nr:hypothetical protein [Bacteroidales bacterium]
MKIKIYLILGFLFIIFRLNANDKDSLLVYLSESDSTLSTNLIFENISSDTIVISGRFKNFYMDWKSTEGIRIRTYRNCKLFTLANFGDMQNAQYIELSEKRFIYLPPKSKLKFNIDISRYFYKVTGDLSVVFDINYNFIRFDKKPNTMPKLIRIETNRVNVKNRKFDE